MTALQFFTAPGGTVASESDGSSLGQQPQGSTGLVKPSAVDQALLLLVASDARKDPLSESEPDDAEASEATAAETQLAADVAFSR
jgi:hypothetical protein